MGALKCEVCGSNDIVKEEGAFVCRGCGMKYSLAEARNLIVKEADAEAKEVVVADEMDVAPLMMTEDKTLVNARRAKVKEDWAEAERLFHLAEQQDPSNIEAFFYAAYAKARASLTDSDLYKRQATFRVLENSIGLIPENFDMTEEPTQSALLRQISADILEFDNVSYVYNQTKNGFGVIVKTDSSETVTLFNNVNAAMIKAMAAIYEKYTDKSKTIYLFECRLAHFDHLINIGQLSAASRRMWVTGKHSLHVSWQSLDPTHYVPDMEVITDTPTPSAGAAGSAGTQQTTGGRSGVAAFFIILSIIGGIVWLISDIIWGVGFISLLID